MPRIDLRSVGDEPKNYDAALSIAIDNYMRRYAEPPNGLLMGTKTYEQVVLHLGSSMFDENIQELLYWRGLRVICSPRLSPLDFFIY